jgi:SAM-dependent methyltransferase
VRTKECPSAHHPNRGAHNWLAYEILDRDLVRCGSLLRGSVYDLGCGEMPYRDWLLRHAESYTGVDWQGSHHELKAHLVADLNEALPVEDGAADSVISISVMEHLKKPQQFLTEVCRILKSGGGLVIQVPWQWWVHEAPHDYFRYTPFGLEFMLRSAGFIDICVSPGAGFFSMMTLKLNYFSLRLIRGPSGVRALTRAVLGVGWYCGQKVAPLFDRLDRRPELEACSYFVTARKP